MSGCGFKPRHACSRGRNTGYNEIDPIYRKDYIMLIKTMAVKITEKTYPIAVACLAAEFLTASPKETYGHYLVINRVVPETSETGPMKAFYMQNKTYSEEAFRASYEFVDGELKTNFAEVRPI